MATAVAERTAIVLAGAGEILGPGSVYEQRRNELRREYEPIIAAAKEITVIDSEESAEAATRMGRLLQVGVKEKEAFFKSVKVQIDAIKAPILAAEKEDIIPLSTEKDRLGRTLTAYTDKVAAELAEAQRKANEEAARKAKEEREEAERIAREELLARAVELSESGDIEEAEAVLQEEIVVEEPYSPPAIIQASSPTKFSGSVGTTRYGAGVIGWEDKIMEKPETHPGWKNFRILVEAVAAGKVPLRALLPNESFINGQGRDYKEGFSMPGCELKKNRSTGFRA